MVSARVSDRVGYPATFPQATAHTSARGDADSVGHLGAPTPLSVFFPVLFFPSPIDHQ